MKTMTIEVKVPVIIEVALEDGEVSVREIGPGLSYGQIYDGIVSYLSDDEATLRAHISEALEEWQ